MSADEFAGFGLAAGVVRGARSFDVDALGRLTGIHYKQVWRPGENESECHKLEDPWGTLRSYLSSDILNSYIYGVSGVPSTVAFGGRPVRRTAPPPTPAKPPHTLSNCACGFYGYYDGSDDYRKPELVSGVVEGYGETLIGTRGFRCTRARIVALNINTRVPERLGDLIARNYPTIPQFDTFDRMVAEFPPDDAGMGVTPDTDPDFWTRSI